jgi:small subunit ribosomal protein S20
MSGLVPLPTRLDWAGREHGIEHEIGLWFEPGGLTRISFVVASPVVASPTDNLEGLPRVANIKSQIKRNKQNEKAHQRNKAVKSSLRTSVRKFREAADAGNLDEAGTALRAATRQLDKAASKGVIHKNQAANRKSAIAKRYAELQTS